MVERYVRDVEVASSNLVTSTSREPRHAIRVLRFFFFVIYTSRLRLVMNTRTIHKPRHAICVVEALFLQ